MTSQPQFSPHKNLLSIITVTLENHNGLRRTHASLEAQINQNFSWVVIDGGSTDESLDYLAAHPPTILYSAPDFGIYDAMNRGIERAAGHYTLFLNAGDTLASPDTTDKIETSLHNDCYFAYGDSLQDGIYFKKARSHKRADFGMFTQHQAMIYSTSHLKKMRYCTEYKIAADYELTLQFLKKIELNHKIQYFGFPICSFKSSGISEQKPILGRNEQFKIRKNLDICSLPLNCAIWIVQWLNWQLRHYFPILYWRTKL